MSTLTISPSGIRSRGIRPDAGRTASSRVRRPEQRTGGRVRLTRRGRIVFLAGFLAVIGVLMVALGPIATATFTSGQPEPVRVVEVGPGDTLYGIAGEVAEPGHIREMVAHIEQLNALDGPELQVGQRLAVPVK